MALVVRALGGVEERRDSGELVVWMRGADDPAVTVTGLAEPTVTPVDGGAYVTALPTGGPYRLEIDGAGSAGG